MRLKLVEPRDLLEFASARNLVEGDRPAAPVTDLLPEVEVYSARSQLRLAPMEVENRPGFVLRLPEAIVSASLGVVYDGFLLPGGVAHSLGWLEERYRRLDGGWCELSPGERQDLPGAGACMLGMLSHWGHFFVDALDRLLLMRKRGWLGRRMLVDSKPPGANVMALARKAGLAPEGDLLRLLNSHDYHVRDLLLPTLESAKPAISAGSFRQLRELVVPARAAGAGTTLFVGRADVKYRFIVNQKALVEYVERHERCMAVFPEFLSIDEAIALFSSAAAIILPVGSAKFNLLFCRPGTRVVCAMPEGYAEANSGVTGMIRHMCHALGLQLCFYSCAIERNPQVLLHSNLLIGEGDLRRMLELAGAR